jgi:hypothetical protein
VDARLRVGGDGQDDRPVPADLGDECLKALRASVGEQHPLTLVGVGVLISIDEVCESPATVALYECEVGGQDRQRVHNPHATAAH